MLLIHTSCKFVKIFLSRIKKTLRTLLTFHLNNMEIEKEKSAKIIVQNIR